MKTTDPFFQPLESHLNAELLKHVASTFKFCPKCDAVLDHTTAIVIDVFDDRESQHKGKQIVCTNCTKDLAGIDWDALEAAHKIRIEVTSAEFRR